jgi:hypothetical protein
MKGFIQRGLRGQAATAVCITLGIGLIGAQAAQAAGPKPFANGLHIASGAIEDPDGRMWVTDHNAGFCRVTAPADGPGTIEHPQTPGDTTSQRTCLGGLLPNAGHGPDAAMAPAFIDPSPYAPDSGDEFVLVPDVAAPSADVVRADWNVETRKFEFRDVITMDADPLEAERPRPAALSLAPDGSVYVVFQRSGSVQRIVDPEASDPTVQLVAYTSDGFGATAVAATHGPLGPLSPARVIVAEATGLYETVGTPTDPALPRTTRDSLYDLPDGPAGGASLVGALTYEVTDELAGTGRLYAGTTNTETFSRPGPDMVLRWDGAPAAPTVGATYADGFLAIAGLGLRPKDGDDTLYVLDDPTIAIAGEPIGTGRMSEIVDHWVRLDEGPEGPTNDTTPAFTFDGEPALECRLGGPDGAGEFAPCADQWPAVGADPLELAAGDYTFTVRAGDTDGAPSEARAFSIDTTPKDGRPTIVSPADGAYTSSRPYFQFAPADGQPDAGYQCMIAPRDTGFAPCAEGRPDAPLAEGPYTLTVRAVDAAGNTGTTDSAPVSFTVGAPPEDSPAQEPAGDLAAPRSWTTYAGGLHIASGGVEAPDGSIWVTDHNAGFCRISDPTISGAGKIQHPELPNRPKTEPRTCLGGLLPEARPGADAAGQPVLVDPTPGKRGSGDEVVLVPDGATKMGSLFRAQWNPSTGRFDPLDEFVGPLDDKDRGPRPTATALGPDPDGNGPQQPDLFYVTKKEDWIVRVQDPATDPKATIVGFTATGRGAEALAVGLATKHDDAGNPVLDEAGQPVRTSVLYLSEPDTITRLIDPTGPDRGIDGTTPQAEPLAVENGAGATAMAYDKQRNVLYMGTGNSAGEPDAVPPIPAVAGIDRVQRYTVGGTEKATPDVPQADGDPIGKFTMVGGLTLRRDGRLLVADDVALIMDTEPIGTGLLYQVGAPAARVASGPTDEGEPALDPTWTSSLNPEFTIEGDGPVQCALRVKGGAEDTLDWKDCVTAMPEGGAKLTATDLLGAELESGKSYRLTVRSTTGHTAPADLDDTAKYVPHTIEFTVDAQKPLTPGVSVIKKDGLSSAAPMFTFTPDGEETSGLEWRCSLNDGEYAPCTPGRTYPLDAQRMSQLRDAAEGTNVLLVKAVDRAGNVTETAGELTWSADATLPVVKISSDPAATDGLVRVGETPVSFTTTVEDARGGATLTVGCRLNGRPWQTNCLDPVSFDTLPTGTHVFRAHAVDHYGNHSAVTTSKIVVDKQGPAVLFDSPAVGSVTGPNPVIAFHADPETIGEAEPGQTFVCTLVRPDGSTSAVDCAAPSVQLRDLTTGAHKLVVTGSDELDNAGEPATFEWTVDASGPSVTFAAGDAADGVELLNRPTFTFAADEDATYQCAYLLGDTVVQDFRLCRSPERSGGLAASAEVYTFVLVARDGFGNISQYRRSFRIVNAVTTPAPAPAPPSTVPVVVPPLDTPTAPGQGQGQGRSQGPGQGQGRRRGGDVPDVGVPITLQAPVLQAQGLPVTIQAAADTNVVRIQVFAVTGGAQVQAAAAGKKPKRRLIATTWHATPKAKTYRVRIKDRKVRSLRPGRYVVEVRGGLSRKTLGRPTTRTFKVKR